MTRTRYKLLRYLVVIVPLTIAFFAPFSEALRWWLLSRYEIRWQSRSDPNDRTQIIAVHNNGSAPLSKARIHLTISSNKLHPVSDFSFARLESGPQISFLDSIAGSDLLAIPAQSDPDKLVAILDSHSATRTLFAVEQTFDRILLSRLQANKQLNKMLSDLQNKNQDFGSWHRVWQQECNEYGVSLVACRQGENLLGAWEISRRDLLEKARKKWSETTGVELLPNNSAFSPSGKVDFTFDLGANESCFLRVYYNPDPAMSISTDVQVLSSSIEKTSQVVEQADLSSPLPLFMFKYHLKILVAFVIILAGCLLFSWPVIRPKQLLPIHKVFKIALSTDDQEYWEHAYQRYRFHVLQQFRDLRKEYNKPDLTAEAEEILDYVRNCLITAYAVEPNELGSEKKLERLIRTRLESLVALPA